MSDRFADWIAAYETAWRTGGTAPLGRLFTEAATYQAAPFDAPLAGLEAIARFWEDEREGPDEVFTLASEIVAAQGDKGVAFPSRPGANRAVASSWSGPCSGSG